MGEELIRPTINIYADESYHLHGQAQNMVVGSVWCDAAYVGEITDKVSLIKAKHGIASHREIKWTKISPAKIDYYHDLVRYFFEDDRLNFRAVIVPTGDLDHDTFMQTPDEVYYKMQYVMLMNVVRRRDAIFRIYLDYKDTWSSTRSKKLAEYLCYKAGFTENGLTTQPVRSYESVLLQLADLFIGAVATKNNGTPVTEAKASVISLIEELAVQHLDMQSPINVDKINLFKWQPQTKELG